MKFIFIFFFLLSCFTLFSQDIAKDSVFEKDIYGIRFGIDLYNPINTLFNNKRKSIELVGDYRFNKKLYIATELGSLNNTINESYYDNQTKGQYVKLGANYNLYENFFNMENEVYLGLRYGFSYFSQKITNITINSDVILPENQVITNKNYTDLNAHWGEFIVGLKTEIYDNLFLGFSVGLKRMISTKQPNNFKNIYVPGFNRVYLNNGGFGFNYTIAYRIPLYKKSNTSIDQKNATSNENK